MSDTNPAGASRRAVRPALVVIGIVLGIAVVAAGCGIVSREAVPVSLDGTTWTAVLVDGKAPPADAAPTLAFKGNQVSGSDGCNQYSGEATIEGTSIKVGPLASTLMLCEGPGGDISVAYNAALAGANRIEIDDQGRLVVGGTGGDILFEVAPQPAGG